MKNKTIDLYGDGIGCVQYIEHWGDDKKIANAARVSFGKDNDKPLDKRDEVLIRYMMENKHTSPFEHNGLTCKFVVPLFVRGQHHRHRTWAYNEISRRYTDVNIQFHEPKEFRTQHKTNRQASNSDSFDPIVDDTIRASKLVTDIHKFCFESYEKMLEAGVCREQARGVLPQNMMVEYYGSCSQHNLMKFLDLRLHPHAQYEIQQVAKALLEIAKEAWPVSMAIYEELRNKNED